MKHIYLVRHCKYSNPRNILPGRLPVALSKEGRQQALKLASYFENKQIEKIYSSAVLRCKQTVEVISKGKIPIEYDRRILETFSAYQGFWFKTKGQLDWKHFFSHQQELGGESLTDVQNRMLSFWKDIIKHPEKNIVICSHGDPIYTLYLHLSNKPMIADETPESELTDYPKTGSVIEVLLDNENKISKIQHSKL